MDVITYPCSNLSGISQARQLCVHGLSSCKIYQSIYLPKVPAHSQVSDKTYLKQETLKSTFSSHIMDQYH